MYELIIPSAASAEICPGQVLKLSLFSLLFLLFFGKESHNTAATRGAEIKIDIFTDFKKNSCRLTSLFGVAVKIIEIEKGGRRRERGGRQRVIERGREGGGGCTERGG